MKTFDELKFNTKSDNYYLSEDQQESWFDYHINKDFYLHCHVFYCKDKNDYSIGVWSRNNKYTRVLGNTWSCALYLVSGNNFGKLYNNAIKWLKKFVTENPNGKKLTTDLKQTTSSKSKIVIWE